MRALCPQCGFHHEVVRVLEEGHGDARRDIYQVAPLAECDRTWLSDQEILEARARFGAEAIIQDDEADF
jgi:hypothetical protein